MPIPPLARGSFMQVVRVAQADMGRQNLPSLAFRPVVPGDSGLPSGLTSANPLFFRKGKDQLVILWEKLCRGAIVAFTISNCGCVQDLALGGPGPTGSDLPG